MNARSRSLSRLREIDWDFAGSFSESPFSVSHWHPGRFASQLPAALIGVLTEEGDCVLDPFAGSGTTLVEAQRLFRRSMGIDINPVSCRICEAKTLTVSAEAIAEAVAVLRADAAEVLRPTVDLEHQSGKLLPPQSVQGEKWYTPKVLRDLTNLWKLTIDYQQSMLRVLSSFCFSSILLSVCRETRHWGYVCDNTTPGTDHEQDVLTSYVAALEETERAYRLRDTELRARGRLDGIPTSRIICGEVSEALRSIEPGSVDLIVTSPPYFGVCDYIKAQRLSLEWMGIGIEELRLQEIGARSKRHRKEAHAEYVEEISAVMRGLHASLKPDGMCALILGESGSRTGVLSSFPTVLSQAGFGLLLDLNRTVSSQRRQAPSIRGEHLLVLQRM